MAGVRFALAVLVLSAVASARADDCATARLGIRARCAGTQGRRARARCLKREAHGLERSCRREALRCDVVGSLAGRSSAVICCRPPRGGGPAGRVVAGPGRCRSHGTRAACVAGPAFESVCDACAADGACAPFVQGRWLFTGTTTTVCLGGALTCGGGGKPPAPVTAVVDVSQHGAQVTTVWDENGSFWPSEGALNEYGGWSAEVPSTPIDGPACGTINHFDAGNLEDGEGWGNGKIGNGGSCEGGIVYTTWQGRLTRLNEVCGNGEYDDGETCDPVADPPGCAAGGVCLPDCRCVVAGVPTCGDGDRSLFEGCDASATPSGCAAGETCVGCERCAATP